MIASMIAVGVSATYLAPEIKLPHLYSEAQLGKPLRLSGDAELRGLKH